MRQRLELATQSASIGIWDYNLIDKNLLWDDRMLCLYGIEAADFTGTYEAWEQRLHPEDLSTTVSELEAAIAIEQDFHTTFRVQWPTGEIYNLESHAMVIRDRHSQPQRMIGVNWDTT